MSYKSDIGGDEVYEFCLTKMKRRRGCSKNAVFCNFPLPPQKKFQMAVNRTILIDFDWPLRSQVIRKSCRPKRCFLQFSIAAPKNFSNGCQSDNFDPRTFAYGSSESLCPKFSETHAGKVSIFKIVGARPLRSQVIRKSCRLKRCFFGIFWEKMLSHGQTVHFWPHSVTHIQKAEHLRIPKIRLKFDFRHPVERQIFGDGVGQICTQ